MTLGSILSSSSAVVIVCGLAGTAELRSFRASRFSYRVPLKADAAAAHKAQANGRISSVLIIHFEQFVTHSNYTTPTRSLLS